MKHKAELTAAHYDSWCVDRVMIYRQRKPPQHKHQHNHGAQSQIYTHTSRQWILTEITFFSKATGERDWTEITETRLNHNKDGLRRSLGGWSSSDCLYKHIGSMMFLTVCLLERVRELFWVNTGIMIRDGQRGSSVIKDTFISKYKK